MPRSPKITLFLLLAVSLCFHCGCRPDTMDVAPIRTPEQWHAWKQEHRPSEPVRHLVCGGPGVSRLLVYLDGTERLVAVEATDCVENVWTAPYRVVHPELRNLPVWSNGHGRDQVEKLLALENPPEIILRLDMPGMGIPSEELQRRTGVPIVSFSYGDLQTERETLFGGLRLLGEVLEKRERAEELVEFFEREIAELRRRTADVSEKPRVYVGGISYRGSYGLNSTMRHFQPLEWLHAENVADRPNSDAAENHEKTSHVLVPREQLAVWNPETIFIDMATLTLAPAGAVGELRTVPLYRSLQAVENGRVFLLLPNSSYNVNFSSQLANAWFIGSVLYPDRFADVDPKKKAEAIFTFLLGDPVLDKIERQMPDRVFRQLH